MVYYLSKLIKKLLMKLPLGVCYFLGKVIGVFFYLNRRKRRITFGNIKSAFPQKNRRQINQILRKSFINFGLSVVESVIAPRVYKYIEMKGEEKISKEGGVIVGIHAGNWETVISFFAQRHNFAVLAKTQKHKGLDRFLNELRREGKVKVCFTVKELIKCIRQDYMIGMVLDHGAESDALAVDFFSHQVSTPKGAVYLAKKFNKKIYTNFSYRHNGVFHTAEIKGPIDVQGRDDKEVLTQLNKVYEGYLRKHPSEYFWYYKRFKYKTNRDVVILSDSKPGHLKQSKAFLSFLSEGKYSVRSKVIEVKYKNKLSRFAADILACFSGKNRLDGGRYLPLLVDKKTWEQLDGVYADIVVSAGSFVAPANKLFSSYLGAKSVTILKPNIPLRNFDLAVIPEHDRPKTSKRTAVIKGALSYPGNLEEKAENCRSRFNLGGDKKISFFLGGPSCEPKVFQENLKLFVESLKEFSLKSGFKVLASTSRRTPEEAREYLEKELGNFANTEALVIAKKENYDFVFEGFSFLSDIIFVSAESISMVSEAASLGKPCVCVSLEAPGAKRGMFLESMKGETALLKAPYGIDSINLKASSMFEHNKNALEKKIKRLF